MEKTLLALGESEFRGSLIFEIGNPYISNARATMLRKALDAKADVVVFVDHDLSWEPEDMLRLLRAEGDVVAGTYRFKKDDEEYMGAWEVEADGRPQVRRDGTIVGARVPAGFLKITKEAVDRFMKAYPDLIYGPAYGPSIDLFNHGAHEGVFWGEDYAFSRRWIACGGELVIVPDLNITHHTAERAFGGNLHEWLMRRPGGSKAV